MVELEKPLAEQKDIDLWPVGREGVSPSGGLHCSGFSKPCKLMVPPCRYKTDWSTGFPPSRRSRNAPTPPPMMQSIEDRLDLQLDLHCCNSEALVAQHRVQLKD